MFRTIFISLVSTILLAACGGDGATNIVDYTERFDNRGFKRENTAPKNIILFFDGTGNTQISRTNVSRLYELIENQNRRDLALFYTSGVGADRTSFIGQATGLGTKNDVQAAYKFLAENWNSPRDRVIVYGYSRGAWTARILAGFLHTAGLVKFDAEKGNALLSGDRLVRRAEIERRDEIVRALYSAYKGREFPVGTKRDERIAFRRAWVQTVIDRRGLTINPRATADSFKFDVFGLFDTVEALGIPNGVQRIDDVNDRYSDQLCNIRKVFHATALDDNRATTYTPVLMTRKGLTAACRYGPKPDINRIVEEVWFSGAHAGVGGGYRNGYLPGVSLNWMIRKTRGFGLGGRSIFPPGAEVFENHHDIVHDAESYSLFFNIFNKRQRQISTYWEDNMNATNPVRYKLHRSVVHRLEQYYRRVDPSARLRDDGQVPRRLETENLVPRPDQTGIKAHVLNRTNDPMQKLRRACFREAGEGRWRFDPTCPYFIVVD